MEPSRYTDPIEEAISHGSQRVAQLASLTAAIGQVVVQRRALKAAADASSREQAIRILRQQEEAIRQQARMSWAPAHDRQWLAAADLIQTGQAWANAAGYADTDPSAATAQRKCEDRLRVLHPYGMARYDRLRADGTEPLDAMREAAPMFARAPHVRVGEPAPARPALSDHSPDESATKANAARDPAQPALEKGAQSAAQAEQRGRQIADSIQARARTSGRSPLGPDELAMVMETVTSLSEELITKISRETAGNRAAPSRQAAHTAAESFPHDAAKAIQVSVVHSAEQRASQPPVSIHKPTTAKPSSLPR